MTVKSSSKSTVGNSSSKRTAIPPKPRIGLALAGGGPLGAVYEIGALAAIEEAIEGLNVNDADIYVGIIAAGLANGITPHEMCRLFIESDTAHTEDILFKPEQLLRPAWSELRQRDSGESIKFGQSGFDDVPISKAAKASAAVPGLFPPVEVNGRHFVDGALRKTLHASIALEHGVDVLICLNPMVPYNAKIMYGPGKLASAI
jgi:predicted acylesterase/phospholipase RssA